MNINAPEMSARLLNNGRSTDDHFVFNACRGRFSFRVKFPQDRTAGSHCCPSQINEFVYGLETADPEETLGEKKFRTIP